MQIQSSNSRSPRLAGLVLFPKKHFTALLISLLFTVASWADAHAMPAAEAEMPAAMIAESDFSADDEDIYRVVDEMPEIVGGIQELYKHLRYPERALRGSVEGRVVVQFVIDENGNVHNPEILRDIGAGCGEAAVDAIQKVQFTPGRQNGIAVPVIYALPINFQIQ